MFRRHLWRCCRWVFGCWTVFWICLAHVYLTVNYSQPSALKSHIPDVAVHHFHIWTRRMSTIFPLGPCKFVLLSKSAPLHPVACVNEQHNIASEQEWKDLSWSTKGSGHLYVSVFDGAPGSMRQTCAMFALVKGLFWKDSLLSWTQWAVVFSSVLSVQCMSDRRRINLSI